MYLSFYFYFHLIKFILRSSSDFFFFHIMSGLEGLLIMCGLLGLPQARVSSYQSPSAPSSLLIKQEAS